MRSCWCSVCQGYTNSKAGEAPLRQHKDRDFRSGLHWDLRTESTRREPKMQSAAVLLIPAYRPSRVLLDLVASVAGEDLAAIVVVDDGSGPQFRPIFDELETREQVTVLRHAVNLGKGAALKTGFNHILLAHPESPG